MLNIRMGYLYFTRLKSFMLKFSGFVGHSYLVHNLNTNNKTVQDGVDIEIQFKTRHSEGRFCY